MMEYFCVVIPLYNKEKSIHICLDSILRQDRLPNEVIVVNDGSTDNSFNEANKHRESFKKLGVLFQIVNKKNGGVSSARNYGIKLATTNSLICFMDADDEWTTRFLSSIEKAVMKFPEHKLFATGYNIIKANSAKKIVKLEDKSDILVINYNELDKVGEFPYFPSSFCARKNAFLSKQLMFPESQHIGEDLSCFYLLSILYDTVYINDPVVNYKIDTPGNTASKEKPMDTPFALKIMKYKNEFLGQILKKKDIIFYDHLLFFFLKSRWKAGDVVAIKDWCFSWKVHSIRNFFLSVFFYGLSCLGHKFSCWSGNLIKRLKK